MTAQPGAIRRAHLFLDQPRIKPLRENTREPCQALSGLAQRA